MLDKDENGVINYSLANVMRIHRPLVVVDEAHNARTDLSFDTLARFRPSAIVEFTATPDTIKSPSNILHSVSAAELKAEYMIKLPIRLETHSDWQSLLADAIAQRAGLEKDAEIETRKTGDYIRPIMLIQAQPQRQGHETLTVEIIEKSLIEDHRIPADKIAQGKTEALRMSIFRQKIVLPDSLLPCKRFARDGIVLLHICSVLSLNNDQLGRWSRFLGEYYACQIVV